MEWRGFVMQAVAAFGAGMERSGLDIRDVKFALHKVGQGGVRNFGLDLSFHLFHSGEMELRDPLVEMIERRGRLPGGGTQGEEAMQIVPDLLEREILLALFPQIREVVGERA